jgi:hypothetical protein
MGDTPKKGAWHAYHPGYLALYSGVSLVLLIAIAGTWASGGAAIPGLIGLFFFVMTGRQLQLMSERD